MKKVGIITLNGEFNYGNRLQAYALQRAIIRLGANPETIVYGTPSAAIKKAVKYTLGRLPLVHSRLAYWRMLAEKEKVFKPFSKKNIRIRHVSDDLSRIADDYDTFITGSDQVWNPARLRAGSINFLSFVPAEKRNSYAASFGVAELPAEQQTFYRQYLSGMRTLSVREEAGVEIVKKLLNRQAELMPDPTLLLEKEEWDQLTDTYQHLANEKYLIIYTLHDLTKSVRRQVGEIAKSYDLEIYQIMGDFYNPNHEIPDPAEFIARIKYAGAVFTDSFHASVFSIIMHTPFVAFSRSDSRMESRLHTLLDGFHLHEALYKETASIADILKHENFNTVDQIVAKKRREGLIYLKKVLSDE